MKKRVKLIVAYDGTAYHGWQVQPNAVTVEGVLNEKLTELLGEEDHSDRSKQDGCRCAFAWECRCF